MLVYIKENIMGIFIYYIEILIKKLYMKKVCVYKIYLIIIDKIINDSVYLKLKFWVYVNEVMLVVK